MFNQPDQLFNNQITFQFLSKTLCKHPEFKNTIKKKEAASCGSICGLCSTFAALESELVHLDELRADQMAQIIQIMHPLFWS